MKYLINAISQKLITFKDRNKSERHKRASFNFRMLVCHAGFPVIARYILVILEVINTYKSKIIIIQN